MSASISEIQQTIQYQEKAKRLEKAIAVDQATFDETVGSLVREGDFEKIREFANEYFSLGQNSSFVSPVAQYTIFPELRSEIYSALKKSNVWSDAVKQKVEEIADELKKIFPEIKKHMQLELKRINTGFYNFSILQDDHCPFVKHVQKTLVDIAKEYQARDIALPLL